MVDEPRVVTRPHWTVAFSTVGWATRGCTSIVVTPTHRITRTTLTVINRLPLPSLSRLRISHSLASLLHSLFLNILPAILSLSRSEIALVEYTKIESVARPLPIFALSFLALLLASLRSSFQYLLG